MTAKKGTPVKLLSKLLTLLTLTVTLTARAAEETNPAPPKLTPEAEAAARKALEKDYTNKAPTRVVPGRITNTPPGVAATAATTNPVVTATPVSPTAAAAVPTPAPAPAAPQVPAPVVPVPNVPATRPATNISAANAAAARALAAATNRAALQATPVVPGIPGAPTAPAPRNVAGAAAQPPGGAAPGVVGTANTAEEIIPPGQIKFVDADIGQVLEIYQELTGRTVLKPTSLPAVKISIRTQTALTRSEAVLALESILSMNGVTMIPQGTKFVKALAEAQAGTGGGEFNDLPGELLPDGGRYVTHVVQLTNSSPNDVLPILQPFAKAPQSILTIPSTGMLVLRDYAENVKRMLEMIAKVDVVPIQEYESVVIPIKYALAGDIAQVLGSLTAGGGGATTVGRQQTRSGLSGAAGGLGGAGGMGGMGGTAGFGQPGYNPNQQGGQQGLGGAGGAAGRSSFQNRLQQIVNRAATGSAGSGGGDIFVLGQTKIIADERINALLVFASKSDLNTISNIIGQLDVVLAQVVIEAIVMEVSLGNNLDYGFSYVQTKPMTGNNLLGAAGAIANVPFLTPGSFANLGAGGGGTNGAVPAGFSYAASFANFDATVKAFAGDSRVKILQRPRIQTSHAVEANLFVGQTRPYPTGTSYGGIGGSYSSIQQLQIGVTLSVLPLINAEGLVVMDIRQKIQDVGEEVLIANVGLVPSTIDREANAKVAVRDGETIMLGGMIAGSKNKTKSGVPILKDIPYLGALFRTTTEGEQRRELIVLIRPTVLQTPEAAATFVKEERTKLPATSSAADEFEESEKKLIEEERLRMEKKNQKMYKKEGFEK